LKESVILSQKFPRTWQTSFERNCRRRSGLPKKVPKYVISKITFTFDTILLFHSY